MGQTPNYRLLCLSHQTKSEFHEDVTNKIFKDLWQLMDPKFMRVIGNFNPRGGIAIRPLVQKFAGDIKSAQKQDILQMLEGWDRNK